MGEEWCYGFSFGDGSFGLVGVLNSSLERRSDVLGMEFGERFRSIRLKVIFDVNLKEKKKTKELIIQKCVECLYLKYIEANRSFSVQNSLKKYL